MRRGTPDPEPAAVRRGEGQVRATGAACTRGGEQNGHHNGKSDATSTSGQNALFGPLFKNKQVDRLNFGMEARDTLGQFYNLLVVANCLRRVSQQAWPKLVAEKLTIQK